MRKTLMTGRFFLLMGFLFILGTNNAAAESKHAFPTASLGDVWFQVDQAGFIDPDRGPIQEFYFRVTNSQIRFLADEEGDPLTGRVFIKLEFLDAEENKVGEASRQFEFIVASDIIATSAEYAELLVMRESIDPRTRFVKIEMEDLNSRKRGLLYVVTGKKKNGKAEGILVPPPFVGRDSLSTSDIQFAWEVAEGGQEGSFEKNGLNVIPNPARTYGSMQPQVSVYYEVYEGEADSSSSNLFELTHEVLSPTGKQVVVLRDTVAAPGGSWARVARCDVGALPSGEYVFRATVRDLAGTRATTSERSFGLVWGSDWNRTEEDILNEARVLYQEKEYERFRAMSSADREVYLEQFWAKNDPTPDTKDNELRDEFNRRVEYANRQYTAFGRKGMISDQGRIYIRFGQPDEIEREIMPTRDRQLDALVPDLEDESITAQNLFSTDEFDVRPFEVWTYISTGYPLFPEREFTTSVTGLRFIFVDESGTGSWVLRYASDFTNY